MAIVNIFSGSYCNGDEVSRLVATELGYEPITDKLINETVNRFNLSQDKLRRAVAGPPSLLE